MIPQGVFEMTARTMQGLEGVLADELHQIGAKDVRIGKRAVTFSGDKRLLYKANYYLRTALNVLVPINTFVARNEDALYKGVQQINWGSLMDAGSTFSVNAVVNSPNFNHSRYVALKTKDAIVDQIRKKINNRPSVDTEFPDYKIHIHIGGENCSVSLDSSGEPLFKRGYRIDGGSAPLNEILAAGIILLSGWDKQTPFIDPMCGSGTLLIEAALIAHNIPPGIYRQEFGFENWIDFEASLLQEIADGYEEDVVHDILPKVNKSSVNDGSINQNNLKEKKNGLGIFGSDISPIAVNAAKRNIQSASLAKKINLTVSSFSQLVPQTDNGIIFINPPYGERIKIANINDEYSSLGSILKHKYNGYEAWVFSGNLEAIKHIGLKPSRKITLFNGPIECKLLQYKLYSGSKKANKN